DHVIRDVEAFRAAIGRALPAARAGKLVTFGIVPTAPETGYGYIECGAQAADEGVYGIRRFVEKPSAERAAEFLAAGGYYWKGGRSLPRPDRHRQDLERPAPAIAGAAAAGVRGARLDLVFVGVDAQAFKACRSDSIDYAVMEKTADAVVVPLAAGWSDVGSWASLHAASEADREGNVARGDVLTEDSSNCYLYSESRLVAAVGLKDHVVIETK